MTPLRERMLRDMQIRNLADNTLKSYLLQVSKFAQHFRRSPDVLGPEEIRAWLVYLREERKLAPSNLFPAVGALRFLYRVTLRPPWSDEDFPLPKKPVRLPVILSLEEIATFFESIASLKNRTILMTAYAAACGFGSGYPSAEPMLTLEYCSGRSLALWGVGCYGITADDLMSELIATVSPVLPIGNGLLRHLVARQWHELR